VAALLCCGVSSLTSPLLVQSALASPPAAEVPDYKIRVRVTGVEGQLPTAEHSFKVSLAGNPKPVEFSGAGWSPWIYSTREGIEAALKAYPNSYNKYWQILTNCNISRVNPPKATTPTTTATAAPTPRPVVANATAKPKAPAGPPPKLALLIESAIEPKGLAAVTETNTTEAEMFGPTLGLLLWRDDAKKVHIDTLTGHGRRVYDKAMKEAELKPADRPKKIIFGDRYIGTDNDFLSWREGITRLSGMGFNALHPVPPNLKQTVHDGGIHKLWGAIYNPPGYAFNFEPNRQEVFVKFVRDQMKPNFDAGWKKEDVGFWVTSDEPGWYYPAQYDVFNKDPLAMAAFHDYLKEQKLTPQDLGKTTWDEVKLIGRKEHTDLPSRRLFYWSNRFVPWASSRFFSEVTKAYEEVMYPGVPVMVNMNNFMGRLYQPGAVGNNGAKDNPNAAMGQHDWLEMGRLRGTTSISTEDWFGDNQAAQWSFYSSRLRSAAQLGGVGFGSLVIPRTSGQRPYGMPQKLLSLVGHGAKHIKFFVYGPEYNFPINCYSENLSVYKPLSTGMRIVAKAEDLLFPGQMRQPQVGILSPQSSQLWDLQEQDLAKGLEDVTNTSMFRGHTAYESETFALFTALQHSAVPVQFIDEQKLTEPDLKNYKVLYVTTPDLPAESVSGLLQWVRDGGTLVTVAGTGLQDRYNQPTRELLEASGVAVASPIRQNTTDLKESGTLRTGLVDLPVFGEHEKLALGDAKATMAFDDGSPAVVEKALGKGRIIRFACYAGLSYYRTATGTTNGLPSGFSPGWRSLITQPVRTAQMTQPVTIDKPLIEAPALHSAGGIAVTLLNWSGVEQSATVTVATDKTVRSVESVNRGRLKFRSGKGNVTVTLPVGDVDVLQVRY